MVNELKGIKVGSIQQHPRLEIKDQRLTEIAHDFVNYIDEARPYKWRRRASNRATMRMAHSQQDFLRRARCARKNE